MIRTHGEKAKYASLMLGTNYRMSEIQAAIGNVQLAKLASFLEKRRQNAQQLTKIMEKSNNLVLPCESKDRQHSWYLKTARLSNGTEVERNRIVEGLKKNELAQKYTTLTLFIKWRFTVKTLEAQNCLNGKSAKTGFLSADSSRSYC